MNERFCIYIDCMYAKLRKWDFKKMAVFFLILFFFCNSRIKLIPPHFELFYVFYLKLGK